MRVIAGNPSIALGGALLGLSFPPGPFPFLALVALVPIVAAWVENDDAWIVLRRGFLFYVACFGTAFFWPLTHEMWPAAVSSLAPILGLAIVFAVPLAATVAYRRRFGYLTGCALLIAAHLLMETALSYGPMAMPWPLLGNVMADQPQVRQLAALSGVAGISLWILTINLLVLGLIRGRRRSVPLGGAAAVCIAAGFFGGEALLPSSAAGDHALIAMAQPAMDARTWADVHSHARTRLLSEMTDSLLAASSKMPELVIWPETTLPPCRHAPLCGESASLVRRHVRESNIPLLSGGIRSWSQAGSPGRRSSTYFNSALLFTPHLPLQRYDKIRLVPFAEYVPFSEALNGLSYLAVPAGGVSGYAKGGEHSMFAVGGRRFGVLICFESVFSRAARELAKRDVDFIVVLSQNGWWAADAAHRQHLAFTRFRAVETGKVVVFASASGSSAIIDVDGRDVRVTRYMERTAFVAAVPVRNARPLYLVWGDIATPLSVLFALSALGYAVLRRHERSNDRETVACIPRDEHAAV